MQYKAAQQRKADGRWDYTSGGAPTGYCHAPNDPAEYERLGIHVSEHELQLWEQFKDKYHTDGHATADEACECYKQFLLDNRLHLDNKQENQQSRCQVCKEFTQGLATVGPYRMFILCDEHRTRETVTELLKVGESWES